ncbi:hypothetical protein [Paraurantiacibacter namhicola]|uniref:Preprotein translocase subunit YajC n=1 Tax=Paraurantiacibacter namhicola TaxID=645517 RepID=A0A1C7D9N1_9SPHN|nr:hypothetical protein [Paraurantiacibacter namhicola]ANU08137.1 hypothetical protein A6F65_01842 [Paraurantiacibacter namhicola]
MKLNFTLRIALLSAALGIPGTAFAQAQPLPELDAEESGEAVTETRRTSGGQQVTITPYIEASQVLTAQLEPTSDVVTYTSVAAGVDANIQGRNSAASASIRYERRFGWDGLDDSDIVTGIARAGIAIVPRTLTLEAGGLASRTSVEGNGGSFQGNFAGSDDRTSQVYSAYIGPSLTTMVGDLNVAASYRFGYTRLEAPDAVVFTPGVTEPVDIFDESTQHTASARIGFAPNTVLPIGVGVGGGFNQQDTSNLDQRIRDVWARGDVTIPVSRTLALVGGVGYEDVEVSYRDAQRDPVTNDPIIGPDGRYVVDSASPRIIAYEADGLIWDAGVMWRPSSRTSFQARVGRRYGSTTYYGSLSYAASQRSNLSIGVYDGLTSFGGGLNDTLAQLPDNFQAFRNPITGNIGGCVASLEGSNCIAGALGSVRSAAYRNRGVAISYGMDFGRTQAGIGAGYDRRKFIAAPGTVLAAADGVIDENYWVGLYASHALDRRSGINANAYVNWFDTGFDSDADGMGYSASMSYFRNITGGLTGTAAVGLDGITQESVPDVVSASALLGLRYSF